MCHFLNDPLWSKSSLTQHPLIECNIPAQGQLAHLSPWALSLTMKEWLLYKWEGSKWDD